MATTRKIPIDDFWDLIGNPVDEGTDGMRKRLEACWAVFEIDGAFWHVEFERDYDNGIFPWDEPETVEATKVERVEKVTYEWQAADPSEGER